MIRKNPVFAMLLGLCPALAVSTRVDNALGLGAVVILVLVFSNLTISLLGKQITPPLRIPAYIVIIATYVTVADLFLGAYTPGLSRNLGIFLPLTAVNCLVLSRALIFAWDNPPGAAILDGLKYGLSFLLALVLIALIREVLGAGTITLFPLGSFRGVLVIPVLSENPIRVFGFSAGAFLVVGYLKALYDYLLREYRMGKEETEV